MEKPFYFLFVFLVLFLISFARSEIEINPQLQIDFNCSTIDDECDTKNAFCNSAGKCQCLFGYSPKGDSCGRFKCGHSGVQTCTQLYNSSYVTCDGALSNNRTCRCFDGFRLDENTQKCVLEKPNLLRLGAHCVANHQCGHNAECTIAGDCRCPAGLIPETQYTCKSPKCSSNEFCHANVTANTVCDDDGHCKCLSPTFEQDIETFDCVRQIRPLGANCTRSSVCGEGAKCTEGSQKICKCQLGYEATSDTVCEVVHCSKDEHCQKYVSPWSTCFNNGDQSKSHCVCNEGYPVSSHTLECTPEAPNIGEPCRSEQDKNHYIPYERNCGQGAACETEKSSNRLLCLCFEDYRPRKDLPFRCER